MVNSTVEGVSGRNSKIILISVPEDPFIIADSADSDEMPHFVASHPSLHCLSVYQITVVQYTKG